MPKEPSAENIECWEIEPWSLASSIKCLTTACNVYVCSSTPYNSTNVSPNKLMTCSILAKLS